MYAWISVEYYEHLSTTSFFKKKLQIETEGDQFIQVISICAILEKRQLAMCEKKNISEPVNMTEPVFGRMFIRR